MKRQHLLLILALSIACSSEPPPPIADAGCDRCPQEAIEISLTATVPAGGEIFRCKYMVLPPGEHDIVRFEHEYTFGSHHILLYPTSLTPAEAAAYPADFDCTSVGELGQIGLAYGASEEPIGEQTFPDGVGLKLGSEQVVLLETHYLNASDSSLDATATVRMFESEVPVEIAAGNLFFYNYAILVPPMPGTATSEMSCDLPSPVELQFASSHMHRRGVHYTSSLFSPDGARTLLHETDDWESAEPATFEPSLQIAGGSRIEFGCDFQNDLPVTVTEGESAETNEMCMFIASYWPQQSEEVEACIGGASGPRLSGDATCLETLDCLAAARTDVATQECIAKTCAEAGPALNEFIFCLEAASCSDESCIETYCGAEYLACESSVCLP